MEDYVVSLTKQSLYLVLILSAAPVMMSLVVGLMVSILQATTQVQEQTLTFVPKLIAIMITLVIAGPWMMTQVIVFVKAILENFASIVKG